jgi:hypothetical protein
MAGCWPSGQTCSPLLVGQKTASQMMLGRLNSAVTLATNNNIRNLPTRSRLPRSDPVSSSDGLRTTELEAHTYRPVDWMQPVSGSVYLLLDWCLEDNR